MFENYLNIAKLRLIETITTEGKRVYLPEILSNPYVHKSYKAFFKAEVEWWIYEERLRREAHQNFDLTNHEMEVLFQQYDSFLIKYAKLDYKILSQLADTAVKLRLNYLCRPRTTLKWFVFRGEPTKPEPEIILRLNYFTDYDYIPDGFKSWLEVSHFENEKQNDSHLHKNDREVLTTAQFEKVIEDIDNEYIMDLSPEKFNDILKPIYKFFNELDNRTIIADSNDSITALKENGNEAEVPIEAIILFLDDKGIKPLANALNEVERIEKHVEYISQRKFSEFIYNYLAKLEYNSEDAVNIQNIRTGEVKYDESLDGGDYKNSLVGTDSDEYSEFSLDEVEIEEDVVDFVELGSNIVQEEENTDDTQNITQEFKEADGSAIYDQIIEEIKAAEDFGTKNVIINNSGMTDEFLEMTATKELSDDSLSYNLDAVILNESEDTSYKEENGKFTEHALENPEIEVLKIAGTELKPLSEIISERLENKFIKKLFNRNTAEYFNLLNSLQYCTSWRETAILIDKFFNENGINPNSSLAEIFRDKIQERFM